MNQTEVERPVLNLRKDVIKPLPSQKLFLDLMYKYEYLLFGGAAGPGKSFILRWALVELLLHWAKSGFRNVNVGLFCENYPTLQDRQLSKIKSEFPSYLGEMRVTKDEGHRFFLRPEYGSGTISFRNLDDPSKYSSAEFAAIAVDELTKNSRQTFEDLRFRKRWPGIEHSPFLAASNPGSRGHLWVKKIWIDRDFSGENDSKLNPELFTFIPARAGENPHLPQSYWDLLNSLSTEMRKAMLEGNWDIFVGQYFEEWNRDLHVCAPFKIPGAWRKIISIDYGFDNPSSVGWYAIDQEDNWYRYREFYSNKLTYSDLLHEVLERTPLDESIYCAYADPSIWGDRPHHHEEPGESGGEIMSAGLQSRDIKLFRANHDRLQGWQRIRDLLKPIPLPDGKLGSRFKVFSTCRNFIRTFPSLVHDEVRAEDLDTDGEDHCADEFRYAVNSSAHSEKESEVDALYASAYASAHNGESPFG